MERLSLEGFERLAAEYDASVEAAAELDRFCTRSDWILSFHHAFAPERPVAIAHVAAAFAVLAERDFGEAGCGLEPLESMWGFASPLVGESAPELLPELIDRRPVVASGLPLAGALLPSVLQVLQRTHRVRPYEFRTRYVASLASGLDGYLARRTRKFRRGLRSAARRCSDAGVHFERILPASCDEARTLYERITEIERESWKARTPSPVHLGGMHAFYDHMLPRLAARRGLRVVIARKGEEDCGYLYGGTIADRFRGLQFSFAESFRDVGLGNALQMEMLHWLTGDGFASYDLGSHSRYKRRWAEAGLTTVSLVALPA